MLPFIIVVDDDELKPIGNDFHGLQNVRRTSTAKSNTASSRCSDGRPARWMCPQPIFIKFITAFDGSISKGSFY
jgi:hypothetical protein